MRTWQSQKDRTACAFFPARRKFRSPAARSRRPKPAYPPSLFVIAALFLSPLATASPLDPPQLIAELGFNLGAHQSTNVFGPLALVDANFGSLSLSSTAIPSPLLIADAIIGPNLTASVFGRADMLLNYGVEVVGPPGAVAVLIDVTGTASAFASAGASFAVEARWDLLDSGASLAGDDIRSGQLTGGFGQGFERTVSLALTANHPYTLFMLVDTASAATLAGSQSTTHSSVDPVFRLAPGVDPQTYLFLFSPGIGNSPAAVPEPRSFVLPAAGLLWIAVLRKRQNSFRAQFCGQKGE